MTAFYSAKQVATRIGTDAKTLRKFLRSPASPYDAVGQGKRYEFPQSDLAELKAAFSKWQSKSKTRSTPPPAEVKQVVSGIKTGSGRMSSIASHAVVMGDKGKCLKCGGKANDPVHVKMVNKPLRDTIKPKVDTVIVNDFDNPDSDWAEFDGEPTEADLAEVEDLLDDLEDE